MSEIELPESGLSENPEAELREQLPLEIDPDKLAEFEQKLEAIKRGEGTTSSGSEAVGPDLSQFEVPPAMEHLYKRAQMEDVPGPDGVIGPHWVCGEHQVMIVGGNYSGTPGSKSKTGQPIRLDESINMIVNGPEGIISVPQHGWRLTAIIPNNSGMGVAVLERNVKRVLPDLTPVPLKTEVAEVKDEELQRMNAEAQQWAAGQKGETSDNPEAVASGTDNGSDVANPVPSSEAGNDPVSA